MRIKKYILATAKSLALVVAASTSLAVVTAVVAPAAFAAEKQKLSSKMKPLGVAQELMGQKKWKEALEKINEVAGISGKSAYEETITNEMKAYCLAQLKDVVGAAKIYEAMLAANQISADQIQAKVLIISQVAFQQKDYAKSIQFGERYIKESGANAEILQQMANAYYLKGDYKTSGEYAQKLIKQVEQAKKPVDKDWLVLLMSTQFKLDNQAGILSTLESLLVRFPTEQYWRDMFKYVSKEGGYSDLENIEIYRLKKTLAILDADEYGSMAELSLAMVNPGDAKAALEAGISAGVLGQAKDKDRTARLLTRAKADSAKDLATLDASAKEAQAKPTGDFLAKIGAAYLGHGLNDKAAAAIQTALTKGGVTSIDEAYIRLGVANLNMGKKAEAIKAFESVSQKSKLARLSRLWVIYAQGKK